MYVTPRSSIVVSRYTFGACTSPRSAMNCGGGLASPEPVRTRRIARSRCGSLPASHTTRTDATSPAPISPAAGRNASEQ